MYSYVIDSETQNEGRLPRDLDGEKANPDFQFRPRDSFSVKSPIAEPILQRNGEGDETAGAA